MFAFFRWQGPSYPYRQRQREKIERERERQRDDGDDDDMVSGLQINFPGVC